MYGPLLLAVAALVPAQVAIGADLPSHPLGPQAVVTFFIEAQDVGPFSSEEMASRARTLGGDAEAVAADNALNLWKGCAVESLARWSTLGQGPGTLIDGAYGRCADLARDYRMHLTRMTPNGRQVVDVQLARTMSRNLEEGWRPRLTAAVLEQMLARQATSPASPSAPRDGAARPREERAPPRP